MSILACDVSTPNSLCWHYLVDGEYMVNSGYKLKTAAKPLSLATLLTLRYRKVAYLDTDVGQPEFPAPGFLSLTVVDKLTPGLAKQRLSEAFVHCYHSSSIICWLHRVVAVVELENCIMSLLTGNPAGITSQCVLGCPNSSSAISNSSLMRNFKGIGITNRLK
ncbi:hypothetical protein LWI29_008581 [Acer saccharum]|uniref:Clp1 P-loop domain-containing protein n=1 Tax=Acer saccharum TaxID=4024 RepID=A0AA39SA42_ACESA|nr:hypothetical protein LWI29_008581 [Acer saccharum]